MKNYILDMDGVIYRGNHLIAGAREFIDRIGDRMDTDILSGLGAGMHTVLVLTGVTTRDDLRRFSYQPHEVVESLADLTVE